MEEETQFIKGNKVKDIDDNNQLDMDLEGDYDGITSRLAFTR